jgi:hypothetical protein
MALPHRPLPMSMEIRATSSPVFFIVDWAC